MTNSHATNVPPPPPPLPQTPSPFSPAPAPSPHRVREKATPTADTEIIGVYSSNTSIHSVNAPPRKRGNMLNAGEGTFEVRAKRSNVDTFSYCCSKSFNFGPFGPNHTRSFPNIQHTSPLSRRSIDWLDGGTTPINP
ncbi:hypothetical protein H5410_015496 [Solanum commersonii]|uniref:Uncharacterized protein n=1 Tax=Solanum commersonii TaxID=4109 RepID=A0A9J5ZU04_SOLCO|nr:hypothetical protein H5410_015496 [Solanum commersonii]